MWLRPLSTRQLNGRGAIPVVVKLREIPSLSSRWCALQSLVVLSSFAWSRECWKKGWFPDKQGVSFPPSSPPKMTVDFQRKAPKKERRGNQKKSQATHTETHTTCLERDRRGGGTSQQQMFSVRKERRKWERGETTRRALIALSPQRTAIWHTEKKKEKRKYIKEGGNLVKPTYSGLTSISYCTRRAK